MVTAPSDTRGLRASRLARAGSARAIFSDEAVEDAMRSTRKTSVREVSPGTFRVSGVRARSAITGRFVTRSVAPKAPGTTVTQDRMKPPTSSRE